ncbi:MAG: META domain-containing protein [Sphingobacteriaceae bacterium]
MKYILLNIIVLSLFSSCNVLKPEKEIVKLDGQVWQLTAVNHKVVGADGRAFLKFDEEELEVTGKAFCNNINAEYERMGDNQLVFQEITSTKMYCDGVMDLENQMVSNLKSVKRFDIRNGMLYLSDSDKVLLTFKK